jgi:spore coat polysaccharide biosynthesis protein SpsF
MVGRLKTVAVIQCRMGSSRLPGTAMLDLNGKPVIQHVLERASAAETVDQVVLATTWGEEDDVLAGWARDNGYLSYAGSPTDVLARVWEAADWCHADIVVRLTGDCPMIEPGVIDKVVRALKAGRCDYASNVIRRTYPKGLDTEALWMDTLTRINRLATSEQARASVTWFAYKERPDLFVLRSFEAPTDNSHINLSVDTMEDLERLRSHAVSH